MIENGVLYKSNGTGWAWLSTAATIQVSKSNSVTELGINRSAFSSLSSSVRVAYKDMTNWTTVSKLPVSGSFALYTLGSARSASNPRLPVETKAPVAVLVNASPNPTGPNDLRVRIAIPIAASVRAILSDAQGRPAYTKNFGIRQAGIMIQEIPTASLAKGIYFLRVQVGETIQTLKLVKD